MAGVLYSFMTPAAADADEFYTWYEAEHVPGRMSVPGFRGVRRYRAVDGSPTGLLLYDIDGLDVLRTDAYRTHQAAPAETTRVRMGGLDRFVRATGEVVHTAGDTAASPSRASGRCSRVTSPRRSPTPTPFSSPTA